MRFFTTHTRSLVSFLLLALSALAHPLIQAGAAGQAISFTAVSATRDELTNWLRRREARTSDLSRSFQFHSLDDRIVALFGAPLFATMVVTTNMDLPPANDGVCSLREAIFNANNNTMSGTLGTECAQGTMGLDIIQFALGAGTPAINILVTQLPPITEPLMINGATGGATRIELNGMNAGAGANGLTANSASVSISSLVINRFAGSGIALNNSGASVQNCLIGTNSAGTAALANGTGISVGGSGNIIGAPSGGGNQISGNTQFGVDITGAAAMNNQVRNNQIGTNSASDAAIPNGMSGVRISGGSGNTIGGTAANTANLISGNTQNGILIMGAPAVGNQILGNRIGVSGTSSAPVPNGMSGVNIDGAPSNTIGSASGGRNLISGNTQNGITITNANGNQIINNNIGLDSDVGGPVPNMMNGVSINNSANTIIGGTAASAGNFISGNGLNGVMIAGAGSTGNILEGNVIGTESGGVNAVPNGQDGVNIGGAPNNTVGGTTAAARNLISGNGNDGVDINGAAATGNQVRGNYIGVDGSGAMALANTQAGVQLLGAPGNTVGGTAAGAGNVISGNGVTNVLISGASASGNQIQGNLIGLNAMGTAAIGGATDGVTIDSAPSNTIGGTASAARNVISGHTRYGVNIFETFLRISASEQTPSGAGINSPAASNNVVQGNFIGLNLAGTAAIANGSIGGGGIGVSDSTGTVIGGTAAGAGNVISGNRTGIDLVSGTGTQIQGNLIGTNPAGTAAIGNAFEGIFVRASSANTIGGTTAAARNIISGNGQFGINITSLGTGGNTIQGNYVGTSAAGTAGIANGAGGVSLGAANNALGGTASGAGNLISGNGNRGVLLGGPASTGNQVQGNFIGVNAAGTAALGNSANGVEIINALNNTIGGTTTAARNIISGNLSNGVRIESTGLPATGNQVQGNFIGLNAAGTARIANQNNGVLIFGAANNLIGGTAAGAGNVISGNEVFGIGITNPAATGNQIQGNLIGTNPAGTAAIGNQNSGVDISSANNNTIGGTAAGARNIISGNGSDASGGITLGDGAAGNQILGNFIGTDITGMTVVANSLSGVRIFNSSTNNIIGGTTAAARNVISGNGLHGVRIQDATTTGNQVLGNYIGANAAGTAALGNTGRGVSLENSPNNSIGGTAAGAGNLVSGNGDDGIAVEGAASSGNIVQGNFVGVNAAGTAALPNVDNGIAILSASNCVVGGTAAGAGNLISGNGDDGLEFSGVGGGNNNLAQGNRIGVNASGTGALGNAVDGVHIFDDASGNTVGGTAAGASNIIANNGNNGVTIDSPTSLNNAIAGNAIFGNAQLGIDLGGNGLTPNDAGDPDAGANNLQNFPVLNSVFSTGVISGSLDSLPANSAYPMRIEFFANTVCDGTNGEGEVFLGFTTLPSPGSFSFPATLVPGKNFITATATDNNGNTSEFSACKQVNAAPTITAAAPLTRQQGIPAINSQIATVSDSDQSVTTLNVTASSLTGTGVSINNITVDSGGVVRADVSASCSATNSTFMLTVSDDAGETATATLTVNVTANTPPALGSYPDTSIATVGGGATVTPSAAPTDDGGAQSIFASAPGFTGSFSVDNVTGVVIIASAGPAGVYTVTVTANDSCGATSTATFMLTVACVSLTVNNLGDELDINPGNGVCATSGGVCTLRAAIQEANALACGSTINFSVTGTIQLGSALPDLTASMTINGPGANLLTVRRNTGGNYRIFTNSAVTTINGLTIRDGNPGGFGFSGGGIYNNGGSLTLNGCAVTNNTAGTGGGIDNNGGSLTIANSVISNNDATAGNGVTSIGGGLNSFTGTVTISNSLFSGNTNSNPLGSMQGSAMNLQDDAVTLTNCTISGNARGTTIHHSAFTANSLMTMTNCTVANNTPDSFPSATIFTAGSGGFSTTAQLRNTLVTTNPGLSNFSTAGNGTFVSLGNNLDSDGTSGFTNGAGGNIVGASGNPVNARLAPLADNGGPTLTHAMRCDSPAIDAGTATGAPATDGRGQSRNQDGNGDNASAVDIGALESQKYIVTTTADSGAGSLRQAITDNNAFGGGLIAFNIAGAGVKTIAPLSALPILAKTVDINGYTQPGSVRNTLSVGSDATLLIELSGASTAASAGLQLTAGFSCLRGLVINQFGSGSGLVVLGTPATENLINGNYIGINAAGTAVLSNLLVGIAVDGGATNNIIGTNGDGINDPAERNVVGGHGISGGRGILVSGAGTSGNRISGNYVGTDAAGLASLPNQFGVSIGFGATNNIIGTNADGIADNAERNVISGNTSGASARGVTLQDAGTSGNRVAGNFIGVDATGLAALPNDDFGGLVIAGGAANNIIGGTTAAERNLIAFNQGNGIRAFDAASINNRITGNSIHSNSGLGIDLTPLGVTANDPGDPDTGPNNLQNFPVLISVTSAGVINGSLDSNVGNSAYPVRIEFFASASCDASGNGEGETFLGFTILDAPGSFSFPATLVPGKNFITATATDNNGNTSEFSACRAVNTVPAIAAVANSRQQGSPVSNSQIATVADPDQPLNTLTVQVNGGTSATVNGVTVSNLAINAAGQVTANIIASCAATNASFTLLVTDSVGEFSSATLNVAVTANTPPVLGIYPNTGPLNIGAGAMVTPSVPPADNGTIASLTASAPGFAGAFSGDPLSGVITITNAGPGGSYTVTVTATDNCGATTTRTFTLLVNTPPAIAAVANMRQQGSPSGNSLIATVSDPNQAPNTLIVQVNGGTSATVNGVTVSNLAVNAGGQVMADIIASCTAANASFTVRVTDGLGDFSTATLNVTVTANTPPVLTYSSPQTVLAGQNLMVNPATGPSDNGSIAGIVLQSAGTYTGGITVNSATGVVGLTGAIPPGSHLITIRAMDNCGTVTDASFTLNVTCPAITVNSATLPNATTGTAYSQTITATGGTLPYSFAVTSGALPAGLALSSGGSLSGTASQSGTFNFTITATDALGCTGNRAYTLVVGCPPFAITISQSPAVNAGQNLNVDVTVTNPCPDVALNTTLTTTTPSNTTFQSITIPAGWICTTPPSGGVGTITCTNNSFAPRPAAPLATAVFNLVFLVNAKAPAGAVITTNVSVTGNAPGRPTVTASASASSTVSQQADLVMANSGPGTVVAGTTMNYSYNITNVGESAASNVSFSTALPPGTVFVSNTVPVGFTCTTPPVNTNGAVTCTAPTLASGTGDGFIITVRINENVACDTTLTNTATVTSATPDPNTTNNISTVLTTVRTQSDLAVNVAAPATAVPDTSAIYTITVTNAGPSSSFNTTLNNALPPAFSAEAVTASTGICTGIGTNTVNCNLGTLAVGATATITIQAHVPETCQPSTAVNAATVTSGNCLSDPAPANNTQTRMTSVAIGNAGPGGCLPAKSVISGTKPGSILFAGLFTSGATAGGGGDSNQNNTRVNLTNTHPTLGVIVHLFFVDGATCTIADAFVCLTANQTTSFFMSDMDPGTSGYMMLIAVDGPAGFAGGHNTGCPISFNYLIGNANIKFLGSPRRDLDLESESTASEFGSPVPNCDPSSSTAELIFDGSPQGYNQLPAVLAMDNIPSRADGNETLLMFGRIDGNWGIGLEPIGPISGIMYNDTENAYSFSFNVGTCLFRSLLSNNFPRTTPRLEQAIPAGRSGWLKFWSANGAALVGAMHVRNDNSQVSANAFEGGHNLHILRLLPRAVITVPVFPPSC